MAAIAIGDVNDDNMPDLAVADSARQGLLIYLGRTNANFGPPMVINTTGHPISVAIGDLNHDGDPDLAVACAGSKHLLVFLGNGNGTFHSSDDILVDDFPRSVAIGDLDSDGRPDLVIAPAFTPDVELLFATRRGDFRPSHLIRPDRPDETQGEREEPRLSQQNRPDEGTDAIDWYVVRRTPYFPKRETVRHTPLGYLMPGTQIREDASRGLWTHFRLSDGRKGWLLREDRGIRYLSDRRPIPYSLTGSLTRLDGSQIEWASFAGHVVIVHFWATWCAPCLREFPSIHQFVSQELPRLESRGARMITINCDRAKDRELVARTLGGGLDGDPSRSLPRTIATFLDPDLHVSTKLAGRASSADPMVLPRTVVLDRQGNVLYNHVGSEDWLGKFLGTVVSALDRRRGGDQ